MMGADKRQALKEVERALDPFRNDLWISRRLALDEVIKQLDRASLIHYDNLNSGPDANNNSSRRGDIFGEHIKFIEFLRDQCSGRQFTTDKQWGHLLNLMSVSRMVNHRSANFNDIIKCRQQIEANAQDIRDFNESIRLCCSINEALDSLAAHLDSCHMTIDPSKGLNTSRCDQLVEICKAERHLENLCGPLIYNLRLQLSTNNNKPKDPRLDRDREAWCERFEKLGAAHDCLLQFLQQYRELHRGLTELEPLLMSLSPQQAAAKSATNVTKLDGANSETLQNSLNTCKVEFAKVVDLNLEIFNTLKAHVRQRALPAGKQQVANSLNLVKLLDSRQKFKNDTLTEGLRQAIGLAQSCQRALAEIKQTLRLEFGRFYFINDLELLTVIALDVRLVEEHHEAAHENLIRKMFNNTIRGFILVGEEGNRSVAGVVNSVGERIEFADAEWRVPLRKRVNIYSLEVIRVLNDILRKSRRSLRQTLKRTLDSWTAEGRLDLQNRSPSNGIDWTLPIQLLDTVEQVKFTRRVEHELGFSDGGAEARLNNLSKFYETQLEALSSMTGAVAGEAGETRDHLIVGKLKLSAAISMTIHFISTLITMRDSSLHSINHWDWQKLARFYPKLSNAQLDRDDPWQLEIRIANATFAYRFDLLNIELTSSLGHDSTGDHVAIKRLISTQTSERCFLVSCQAISKLRLGASPYGPAGSGKTETIKALGNLIGCQVIVHNCDETNDADSLERLVWGLAHTGLWGCFDEFNRLSSGALSSVSAVLELVQASLRSGQTTIELAGGQIKSIDPDSAFFVTLNPGDVAKYRGRRRLPANLRALFLPVAMYRVQIDVIVREMLLVYGGFQAVSQRQASKWTRKFGPQMCSDMGKRLFEWIQVARADFKSYLTASTSRCEFDLRLVLVILRRFFNILAANQHQSDDDHLYKLLVESIQLEVEPRLSRQEVGLFDKGLATIFRAPTQSACKDQAGLLRRQLELRSGVILLGQTQTGKSTSWRKLLNQLNKDREQILCFALNPKSCNKDHLFGSFQPSSRKWVDGLFTRLARRAAARIQTEAGIQQAWLILDGSIDPDWIECLNSVLDDNQVLTLSSGERINFIISPERSIKLIFETDSIEFASPATISRLGLVLHERQLETSQLASRLDGLLELVILHGGSSESRLSRAMALAADRKSIVYKCSDLSTSNHLVELLQLATSGGSQYSFIVEDLNLIRSEDQWGTRTLVEMLRYMITYKQYYNADMDEIKLGSETNFILTSESLESLSDDRLVSLATMIEAVADEHPKGPMMGIPFETAESFAIDRVASRSTQSGANITILRGDFGAAMMRNALKGIPSAAVEIYQFNSSSAQLRSIEKLESLANIKVAPSIRTNLASCCLFVTNSLELQLMGTEIKRQLYHLISMLRARDLLLSGRVKFLVYLAQSGDASEREFWSTMGLSHVVEMSSSCGEKFLRAIAKKYDAIKTSDRDIEWLAGKVSQLMDCEGPVEQNYFVQILVQMIASVGENIQHHSGILANGLRRLNEFGLEIERIKSRRGADDESIREKKANIESLMQEIDLKLRRSEEKREQFGRLEGAHEVKSAELEVQAGKIQAELESVLPLIESSKQEVRKCLKPEALNEIKTLRAPPKTIKDILDVLFIFLDIHDSSWASIKAHLTKSSLRDELTSYDFELRLSSASLRRIELAIESRRDSFQMQQARRASSAVVPILKWIEAAIQYGRVSVKLKPLGEARDGLAREMLALASSMEELAEERKKLEALVESDTKLLHEYQADYSSALEAAKQIELELEGAQAIIQNSNHQVLRWQRDLERLEQLATNERDLYRVCLVCTVLASSGRSLRSLADLMSELGDNSSSSSSSSSIPSDTSLFEHLMSNYVNTVLSASSEDPINLEAIKPDELNQTLQLIRLKLSLLFKCYPRVPFLKLDKGHISGDANLLSLMSFKSILSARDDLLVVRPESVNYNNWRQSIELAVQLNKLILIELNEASINLDLIDVVLTHHHQTKLLLFGRRQSGASARETPFAAQMTQAFHLDGQRLPGDRGGTRHDANKGSRLAAQTSRPKGKPEDGPVGGFAPAETTRGKAAGVESPEELEPDGCHCRAGRDKPLQRGQLVAK